MVHFFIGILSPQCEHWANTLYFIIHHILASTSVGSFCFMLGFIPCGYWIYNECKFNWLSIPSIFFYSLWYIIWMIWGTCGMLVWYQNDQVCGVWILSVIYVVGIFAKSIWPLAFFLLRSTYITLALHILGIIFTITFGVIMIWDAYNITVLVLLLVEFVLELYYIAWSIANIIYPPVGFKVPFKQIISTVTEVIQGQQKSYSIESNSPPQVSETDLDAFSFVAKKFT